MFTKQQLLYFLWCFIIITHLRSSVIIELDCLFSVCQLSFIVSDNTIGLNGAAVLDLQHFGRYATAHNRHTMWSLYTYDSIEAPLCVSFMKVLQCCSAGLAALGRHATVLNRHTKWSLYIHVIV